MTSGHPDAITDQRDGIGKETSGLNVDQRGVGTGGDVGWHER